MNDESQTPFDASRLSARALLKLGATIRALNERDFALEELVLARTLQRGGCPDFQALFRRLGVELRPIQASSR